MNDKERAIRANSLVLYKHGAARVTAVDRKKLEIEREGGERLNVRHKDVALLHPGPLHSLRDLRPQEGEVVVAWELLAGATTTVEALAELIYERYTPETAWATWQLIEDGLYFRGTPEAVVASTPEEVAAEKQARAERAAQAQAWNGFVERIRAGHYAAEDIAFLQDVEELAYGRSGGSRVLRELDRAETAENGHSFLLECGFWDTAVNPYPARLGLPARSPSFPLPGLPDEERLDLTHLPAFAIDDEGSTDPDDAVSVEDGPAGARLWVHVADVAVLVKPDSAADEEARGRGASLYLPEGTVQMLPPEATQRLALGLDEVSPALSFRVDLAADGAIADVAVMPTWVHVERLSYGEAEARLQEAPLQRLYRIACTSQKRRERSGALNIELPEVKVRVVDGEVMIYPLPNLRSRDLVREAMLVAGEAAARFAMTHRIPIPFTVQEAPDLAASDIDALPDGYAGQFALRRTFSRSQAVTEPGPHSGLGLPVYAQVTSPLRRYLDLVVHQQVRAFLQGDPLLDETAILERVGAAEAVRGDVRYAERLSNEHWTLVYFLQHPQWRGKGVIVEQYGQRSKLLLPDLAYEVHMYLRRQRPLNGEVMLELNGVNLAERTAFFREAPG